MRRWLDAVLDLLLPPTCEVCDAPLPGAEERALCAACRATMSPPSAPLCAICGVPLDAAVDGPCATCRSVPPAFATARAAAVYQTGGADALGRAVQRLKYDRRRALAAPLGRLMAARYPFPRAALVVPVPLHVRRLRVRGFNQAELLATVVGRRCGVVVATDVLVRRKATVAQPGLGAAARRANLRDAMCVVDPARVAGRHVVLVDDVLTTGAMADACARVLRAAGARRVDVFTLGRAPAPSALEPQGSRR